MKSTKPGFYLWVTEANGAYGMGMAKKLLATKGWKGVLDEIILPQLEWLKPLGEPIGIIVHRPFGHWTDYMAIDAYDNAVASRCGYFTDDLDKVWGSLSQEHECIAYVGGLHLPPHLRDRPASELGPIVERTMGALHRFDRVCIDTSQAAYSHWFVTESGHVCKQNNEQIALGIADYHFGEGSTIVEATPRNHPFTKHLWPRDAFILEKTFRLRHGWPIKERRASADAEGYGNPYYMLAAGGRILRAVTSGHFKGNTNVTMEAARRVLKEGDVLVLAPRALIAAGHKALELVA